MKTLMPEIVRACRATFFTIGSVLLATGFIGSCGIAGFSLSFEDLCKLYIAAGVALLAALGSRYG
jgi:hypothetical protein